MWIIQRRDHAIREWAELGRAADLKAAADFILRQEQDTSGALFFCCYVDPHSDLGGKDDSELLSRFEHRTERWLYLVNRIVQ